MIPRDLEISEVVKCYETFSGVKLITELKKAFPGLYGLLAEQIKLRKKAVKKFPEMVKAGCLFTAKSLEQASSPQLAGFKALRFSGNSLLDLSGGLGVDDIAFSKSFNKVTSLDIDSGLNEIVRYNLNRLKIRNIERIDADAYNYVSNAGLFDMIYLDSDRRAKGNKAKSITLHDAEPSILKIKDRLFRSADKVLVKLSPLIDLTYLIRSLPEIRRIMVISFHGEVKEVLALLENGTSLRNEIRAIEIEKSGKLLEYTGSFGEKLDARYQTTGKYLIDPLASLVKSGLVESYAEQYKLSLVSSKSAYLICDKLPKLLFGRTFEIIRIAQFSKAKARSYLRLAGITKANISSHGFGVRNEELKKSLGLNDGGDDYLFFAIRGENEKLFYHCRKN